MDRHEPGTEQPITDLCEQIARNQINRISIAIAACDYDKPGDYDALQSFMALSQMLSQWLDRLMAWHEFATRPRADQAVPLPDVPVETSPNA